MGQAKLKRQAHAAILADHSGCIYCAGTNAATTIEHMPPISVFEGSQRPKGFEFPACVPCNNGTGHSDLVAAMLARIWPDANSEVQKRDVKKLYSAIANNIPQLLHEMNVGRAGEKLARKQHNLPTDAYPMRADGPLLTHHIHTFAAKFGFALHYEVNGEPVPTAGGVQVRWFSNVQALNDELLQMLVDLLPSPATLQQGVKSVAEQFRYSYIRVERDHLLYLASFNKSFAIAGVTATDRTLYLEERSDRLPVFKPGDFICGPVAASKGTCP
jgi:hypothetical protein